MYSAQDFRLKVCGTYLRQERNREALRKCRVIMLEHILPTTESLVNLLQAAGADIHTILAKPYSVDEKVFQRLSSDGFRVLRHSYEELEDTNVLPTLLEEAINASRSDDRSIVIIDVGGYFAHSLKGIAASRLAYIVGVVEDTTFGHNRYLATASDIEVPIISVARSGLKEIESICVGHDAVQAVDNAMRDVGGSIRGKNALVIGYGMIGKNVARALNAANLSVSIHDLRDHRNLTAFMSGFRVNKKAELLRTADVVFCATGWSSSPKNVKPALSPDEILERVNHNAILASVGSKDNEFDVKSLSELAVTKHQLSDHVVQYDLPNTKTVFVIKNGTAVNFLLPSIPTQVLDLVFSEIVLSVIRLVKNNHHYQTGRVHTTEERDWNAIAKDWLRFTNT